MTTKKNHSTAKTVKKALIPAAGLGTRFLPATKTIPKEMLPIVDAPTLLYVVEEAARAGIEDIIIVAGRGKSAIEDFFDRSYELEDLLAKAGKTELLERLLKIRDCVNIISIRQKEAKGLGHAVYCGRPIIGNEPFAVLLGDEIMIADKKQPTATQELTQVFSETGISTVAVMEVSKADVEKYGIIDFEKLKKNLFKIKDVVEKPRASVAPSQYALPGRYVFSNEIFSYLENAKPGKNGEIQLTDSMTTLAKKKGLYGMTVQAKRYDAGDKLGYLIANIEIALSRPELGPALKKYLQTLIGK
jgi:UTP--glucose-1-phosphate uridylyltransferase